MLWVKFAALCLLLILALPVLLKRFAKARQDIAAGPQEPVASPPRLTQPTLERIAERMTAQARLVAPQATVGATQYAHQVLARAYVTTDAEKAALRTDPAYLALYRDCLLEAGYDARQADRGVKIGLDFESQETVDRDYGGNWRHALA